MTTIASCCSRTLPNSTWRDWARLIFCAALTLGLGGCPGGGDTTTDNLPRPRPPAVPPPSTPTPTPDDEPAAGQPQLQLIMSDEFDGTELDRSIWNRRGDGDRPDDGCPQLCGFGNNELQVYASSSITVADGLLVITAYVTTGGDGSATGFRRGDFRSARINTRYNWSIRYGRIEARVKLPAGLGTWPAVWMLPTDEVYGGWPQSGEIDIVEAINLGANDVQDILGTIHFGLPWPQNSHISARYTPPRPAAEDFHVYAVEWDSQGEIRFYFDDVHYGTRRSEEWFANRRDADAAGAAVRAAAPAPFDQDFFLIINLAIGGNFPGFDVDTSIFPVRMMVDYVRIYALR